MKIFLLGLFLIFSHPTWAADDSPGEAKNIYGILMQAMRDGDPSVFQELGDDVFKKQMTPELFQTALADIGPRLRGGYRSTYLGKIQKNGKDIFLWKITPEQSQEELLVTMVLQKNKVAAFYFQ